MHVMNDKEEVRVNGKVLSMNQTAIGIGEHISDDYVLAKCFAYKFAIGIHLVYTIKLC